MARLAAHTIDDYNPHHAREADFPGIGNKILQRRGWVVTWDSSRGGVSYSPAMSKANAEQLMLEMEESAHRYRHLGQWAGQNQWEVFRNLRVIREPDKTFEPRF